MTGRLRKLSPAELDEDQRAVYGAVAGGRRAHGPQLFRLVDADGGLEGPFNAFLLQPKLGFALQSLGAAVRYETGLTDVVDPLGGSYCVERLTADLEAEARRQFAVIDGMGGMVAAIEAGYPQREIAESAYRDQQAVASPRISVSTRRCSRQRPPA